jgi:uncharacterized protein (DUF1330 family)
MIQTAKLLLALVLGIVIGAEAIPSLQAQPGRRGAYIVAETQVTEPAGYMEYLRREPDTLTPYRGRVLAHALPDIREGTGPNATVAIVAFDSLQDADGWYNSPAYAKLRELRQSSAKSRVYILDGAVQ